VFFEGQNKPFLHANCEKPFGTQENFSCMTVYTTRRILTDTGSRRSERSASARLSWPQPSADFG
jgi:hypothetical protein